MDTLLKLMLMTSLILVCSEGSYYYNYYSSPYLPYTDPYYYRYHYPHLTYQPKVTYPVFQVEVMKPAGQMKEQKTVPLYIIPQNSWHCYPLVQKHPFLPSTTSQAGKTQTPSVTSLIDPSHLPAVEFTLYEPILVSSLTSYVTAPAGFTVYVKGAFGNSVSCPIKTEALVATIPTGTQVTPDSPIYLETLYALPYVPTKFHTFQTTEIATTKAPSAVPFRKPSSISTAQYVTSGQEKAPASPPAPFINSKESPYLKELREQSIRKQIAELEELLATYV